MYLKRLDITGFKSFAHKTALEFDRGVVSIVGPNGSGKSNVADAIRWVLGEQSVKLLRGKKADDVIFSGSDRKARLGMAEVSIELDNEDRQMPVDYPEVVITRRIYRDGEGEYFLNKAPIRLQDIHLLLAKSGIGQKSYSVIGQGMIDHVLVATPAERKVFFDEAAGVRQFQMKREQAIHKLEQTRENLAQAQMLLAEIEPRLRTLTRQVRRLERRGLIETGLRAAQQQYYSLRIVDLLQQLQEHEKIFAEREKIVRAHEEKLLAVQQELETLERERTRHEAFQALQREYGRTLEQKNAVMKEQVVLEGAEELEAAKSGELNVVWLQNRERELARSLAELTEEMGQLEHETAVAERSIAEKQKQRTTLLRDLEKLERRFREFREQSDRGGVRMEELESDVRVLHEEFASFKEQVEKAASDRHLAQLKRAIGHVFDRFTALLHRFHDARHAVQPHEVLALQAEQQRLTTTKDVLTQEAHDLSTKLERRAERLAVLGDSRTRLAEEHDRVRRELERLAPSAGGKTAVEQRQHLETQLVALDKRLHELREQMLQFNQSEQQKKEHLFKLQKAFRVQQNELTDSTNALNATRVELAKLETRRDDLQREVRSEMPAEAADTILTLTAESAVERNEREEKLLADINDLKHQLELIGGIDEGITQEFHQTDERHAFLSGQVKDLEEALVSLEKVIAELDATIKTQFHQAFTAINREFGKYFKILFNGGSAKLVLQEAEVAVEGEEEDEDGEGDDEDASGKEEAKEPAKKVKTQRVIAGIDFLATPPGKRISGIAMLSGGERALTSIALICAILAVRPSPFVVLDEVDAALDEANTQRFAAIIKELARKTQFITITHNRSTMQISSILYGITMGDDGISKLLSIRMEDAEAVIAQQGNRA